MVRLLASVLRESGMSVLAKTTGSEAKYILPNGEESDVPRQGIVSIIEQKNLLKKAAGLGVDCLVAEVMSIQPENHFVESQKILKPNIIGITNVRPDHIDAMGQTDEEIASTLSLDISEQATVFIPGNEHRSLFDGAIASKRGKLVSVPPGISFDMEFPQHEIQENLDLVFAIAEHLNIDPQTIRRGILKTKHDIGRMKIWKSSPKNGRNIFYFVNGFAANDPQSTFRIFCMVKNLFPDSAGNILGVLSLRADRADRSYQWLHALKKLDFDFKKLYLVGPHANVLKGKIKGTEILKEKNPDKICEKIMTENKADSLVFGFGNFKGTGRILVEYWNRTGEEYGL